MESVWAFTIESELYLPSIFMRAIVPAFGRRVLSISIHY